MYFAAAPTDPAHTLAVQFARAVTAATRAVEDWPEHVPMPDTALNALVAAVNIACDALYDADVEYDDPEGLSRTSPHRVTIEFPDESTVTAFVEWTTDTVEIFTGRTNEQERRHHEAEGATISLENPAGLALLMNINERQFEALRTDPEVTTAESSIIDMVNAATQEAESESDDDEGATEETHPVCG